MTNLNISLQNLTCSCSNKKFDSIPILKQHLIEHFYILNTDMDYIRNKIFEIVHAECRGDEEVLKNLYTKQKICPNCGWSNLIVPVAVIPDSSSPVGISLFYDSTIDYCQKCCQWWGTENDT